MHSAMPVADKVSKLTKSLHILWEFNSAQYLSLLKVTLRLFIRGIVKYILASTYLVTQNGIRFQWNQTTYIRSIPNVDTAAALPENTIKGNKKS